MSEEDTELEKLKAKRLAEMQKNIDLKKKQESLKNQQGESKSGPKPREIVVKQLGYRGVEVLEAAEYQFPRETKYVVEKIAELVQSGELNETIDGGQLLSLFRTIGLNVRLDTAIKIEKDGKFVSISDKITGKKGNDQDEES